MSTATASIIVAVLALAGTAFTQLQSRRGSERSAGITERAQVFAELQALKDDLTAARKQCAELERKVRAAASYIDDCMQEFRRHGIEAPPIPNRAPAPWEE